MKSERWIKQSTIVVITILFCFALCQSDANAQSSKGRNPLEFVQERHRDRYREFSNELKKLADECEKKELTEAAAKVLDRNIPPESLSLKVDKLPSEMRPEIPANLPADERQWQTQLRYIETQYAKDLYIQSRTAMTKRLPSYAYNLVREAAIHDPDHVQVRKILGFVRLKNEWVTPFAASQLKLGKIYHEEYGWLLKSYVPRYDAGERNFNNRWITAEKEKELRRDFSSAWVISTDHYQIKTNVSLEKGVELGKALEDFHGVFYETFAGFFNSPEQLQKLFDGSGRSVRPDAQQYTVHFYRTREEYLERLRKFFPTIDQSNGVYMTTDKVAHFYHDPNNDNEGTLYHEATHQLFYESHQSHRTICENHHFWIIEGIACYMESFQRKDGSFTLGDPNHIRFAGARRNLLQQNYYVPLREFSGFGMHDFQQAPDADLVKNYTQAAGLARFFMHYEGGRYRDALVNHLAQLYSSETRTRDRAKGMDELTGVDFTELDRQYAEDARQNSAQPQKVGKRQEARELRNPTSPLAKSAQRSE